MDIQTDEPFGENASFTSSLSLFKSLKLIREQLEKLISARVGQPLNLNLPASLNLFKLSCFGVAFADLNSGRPLSVTQFFKLFLYKSLKVTFKRK